MTNKNNTINIPVERIYPFEGHPYKVKDNEEMNHLIESIQANGVLTPIIVRPKENTTDEYEVISGHRRLRAVTKAGIKTIPAIIMPIDRDMAAIAVVDSNLHRENILPSEKAFAYKLKLDAMKRQGKRTDLTSVQVAPKLATELIAESDNTSKDTVKRYIRLTNLIPPILDMVDDGKIAFTPAVELSYLQSEEQKILLTEMQFNDCTPNLSQAQRLKRLSLDGALTRGLIMSILGEEKANQKERIKIPVDRIRQYFPKDYTTAKMEAKIVELCEAYHRNRVRSRDTR